MSAIITERIISINDLRNETIGAARAQVMDIVQRGVGRYELVVASSRAILRTIAADTQLIDHLPMDCDALNAIVSVNAQVRSLTYIDREGAIVCATSPGAKGLDLSGRDYFRIALRGISNLQAVSQNYLSGEPAVYLAEPVADAEGTVNGVLVARVTISELLPGSFGNTIAASSQSMAVDPGGTVLVAYPPSPHLVGTDQRQTEVVSAALARTSGTIITPGPDEVARLYGFTRLPSSNMHLIVGIDLTAVTAQVEEATWHAGITLLIAVSILLGGLWIFGEKLIIEPVQSLSRRLIRFGRGEASEDTTTTVVAELEPLATAFEAMAEELTRRENALRSANRRLSSLASLDSLTGIANRRSFDSVFAVQWGSSRSLALLMVDIDNFKAYNDFFGHQEGDRCIRAVAHTLAGAVRGTDIVARIGGEEFAVLMPGAGLSAAADVAERLRHAIENLDVAHAPKIGGHVTVSIGCAACVPSDHLRGSDLMLAADTALYAAKRNGRNRTSLSSEVQPGGGAQGVMVALDNDRQAGG